VPPADGGAGHPWREADGNAGWPVVAPPGSPMPEAEFAAIVRRAAQLGIPAWRVSVALGRPLPQPDAQ
jgi:hypothetical protein